MSVGDATRIVFSRQVKAIGWKLLAFCEIPGGGWTRGFPDLRLSGQIGNFSSHLRAVAGEGNHLRFQSKGGRKQI